MGHGLITTKCLSEFNKGSSGSSFGFPRGSGSSGNRGPGLRNVIRDAEFIPEKQVKAANNKAKNKSGTVKQVAKQQRQEAEQKEREEQPRMFMAEVDIDNNLLDGEDDDFVPSPQFSRKQQGEIDRFLDSLLDQKIGKLAHLVVRYLDRPGPKRNTMPLHNTAKASLRCGVSPSAAAIIASEFLKDLIAAGHLDPGMAYLACDPSKLYSARKAAMEDAREQDLEKHKEAKIVGMGYDGRKD